MRAAWLALLVAPLLAACGGRDEPAPLPEVGTEVGQLAPELEGRLAAGEGFRLADGKHEATVLVFYRGGSCGLCRERLRSLGEHRGAYAELGARVVPVTPDPPERVAETLAALGLELPVVSVDSATLERWGVLGADAPPLPATFVLDRRRVIEFRHLGRNAGDQVGDATLLALLQQRKQEG